MPSWFGFLALEADLAMTFIDCARLRTLRANPEGFANSVNNARKALAEIQRGLVNPTARGLSGNEASFLERRSGEIESALVALTADETRTNLVFASAISPIRTLPSGRQAWRARQLTE